MLAAALQKSNPIAYAGDIHPLHRTGLLTTIIPKIIHRLPLVMLLLLTFYSAKMSRRKKIKYDFERPLNDFYQLQVFFRNQPLKPVK